MTVKPNIVTKKSWSNFEKDVRNKGGEFVRYIDSFMWRTAVKDDCGWILQSVFLAPATGDFTFWMLVNEMGKFYFGKDQTEASKVYRMGGVQIGSWGE